VVYLTKIPYAFYAARKKPTHVPVNTEQDTIRGICD